MIARVTNKGPVLLILAGILFVLMGLAIYLSTASPMRLSHPSPYGVRPVEDLPPGFYCLDATGDGRVDAVIWARSAIHVLRRDGTGLWPCRMHGPPLAVEARGWILYVPQGDLLDLRSLPEASP
ncbi:MAG: hypothetical protein RML46_11270 [Anaerolineae bacterium]|nr:hypothetical protein [Anaerolineae bacterium]